MAIEPNEKPATSEADRETLKRVYQTQIDEYEVDYVKAAKRLDQAIRAYDAAREEFQAAIVAEAKLAGKIDQLRLLAARDGVTLD